MFIVLPPYGFILLAYFKKTHISDRQQLHITTYIQIFFY